jgi:hypothetical protein
MGRLGALTGARSLRSYGRVSDDRLTAELRVELRGLEPLP